MTAWSDVAARARGLSTRLRPASGGVEGAANAQSGERDMRNVAAARFALLDRWAGSRARILAVLFEDEDRRTLRALLRGAVANVPPSRRLAGLVPTPTLPAALLTQLAEQPNAAGVVSLLAARGHAYGPALLDESRSERPHLLTLEALLDTTFAVRATRAARSGDAELRTYVRLAIDIQNCWSAVIGPTFLFLPGGERVHRTLFNRAIAARDRSHAADILAPAFRRTALGAALRDHAAPATLDGAALTTLLAWAHRAALRAPLGTAPIIWYVLAQLAELRRARRLAWGVALGAP